MWTLVVDRSSRGREILERSMRPSYFLAVPERPRCAGVVGFMASSLR